jgi:hypothetical protein
MMTNWRELKQKANLDPARVAEFKQKLLEEIRRAKQLEEWEKDK